MIDNNNLLIIDYDKFDYLIKSLIYMIKQWKNVSTLTNIVAIPRGGLVPGVYLSHALNIPLSQEVSETSLVVDDVADSGVTLLPYRNNITATLHYKPSSLVMPTFYVEHTTKWIVYPWETN